MESTRNSKVVQHLKAKRLYVNRFLPARQVALNVGVTTKTIGNWIKAGNWTAEREAFAEKQVDKNGLPINADILLLDFLELVKETAPHLANEVLPIINEYLSLNK